MTKNCYIKNMKYIALNDTIIEKLQAVVKIDTRHKSRARAQAF